MKIITRTKQIHKGKEFLAGVRLTPGYIIKDLFFVLLLLHRSLRESKIYGACMWVIATFSSHPYQASFNLFAQFKKSILYWRYSYAQ